MTFWYILLAVALYIGCGFVGILLSCEEAAHFRKREG